MQNINPFFSMLDTLKTSAIKEIMVCLPGKIISYNSANQRAQIECGINRSIGDQFYTIPIIENVPVQFSGTKEWVLFHELPPGTEGLIHFSQRAVDAWLDMGGPVAPTDARMFNATDAFFSPGYRSMQTVIPGLPTSGVGMSNRSGSVRIHMTDDGITLSVGGTSLSLTSSGMTYNGPEFTNSGKTTLNGRTTVNQGGLSVEGIEFGKHVHSGVQSGNGTTRGPQ
ncbi:hypothetical protein GPY51_22020 [Photorhabdus laumondii subsp. laumondii]|uniref:Phage protein Gp138 N-terminal domain-containing protein n=1 Tax=Photorhabdus laumondii subsp. laumondii TaxID=141679 RepID=A0A6L9JXC7_PHOLM|nr:Gp138 family membrane-puncturing spike protein [Photorhabdus laumondii]MCC8385327.1 hypothetical protein [Photorhabdus laumondii]MCC8414079.1 hypothetical protein [Photorhabdus laumondii]NDK96986.1 hypothetical protein [Photorhabdus laumondii subsp. laumondii]NDL23199.1 hypothetical protein [Photorhabdus laumondii subsp. laumondii]NDL32180.1 hypothetical protein [Photorhabdus laumondii subsp. laumondii]